MTSCSIPCNDVMLEGEVNHVDGITRLAILCHPHPEFGGTMWNNVINALFHGLGKLANCSTMRFNFSGVGRSTGMHQGGKGEIHQVSAAIRHAASTGSWNEIHVVGYSFGAAVSAPAAFSSPRVTSFTGIAFPFDFMREITTLAVDAREGNKIPVLLVTGDRDEFTTMERFSAWARDLAATRTIVIPEADHFLGGHEDSIVATVVGFIAGS